MRWKYKDGEMIWETPLCTYKVYPTKRDGEILYVLEYSDKERDLFYNRADAKGSAEADYENRVYKNEIKRIRKGKDYEGASDNWAATIEE